MTLDEQLTAVLERSQIGRIHEWWLSKELVSAMQVDELISGNPIPPTYAGVYKGIPVLIHPMLKGGDITLNGNNGQYASRVLMENIG